MLGRTSNKAVPGARRASAAAPGALGRALAAGGGPVPAVRHVPSRPVPSRPAAVRGSGRSAREGWKSRGSAALRQLKGSENDRREKDASV